MREGKLREEIHARHRAGLPRSRSSYRSLGAHREARSGQQPRQALHTRVRGPLHLNHIRFRPDVYKMLTMPGKKTPHIIPDAEFNNFRRIIDTGNATFINRPLRKGDKVRITDGALAGCMAFVQRIQGKKVIIGNELLYIGGATIEVDRESLEFVREGRSC